MNPNLERAILLFQQSRYEMAETELAQALGIDPHDAYAHALLGLCLAQRDQFEDATAEVRQAIHLQPDFPFAHYAHARVLYQRNRFAEARAAIEEAIRLDAADPDYFWLLAGIHFNQSRWQDALNAAEQGLRCDAEHVGCTNLRAMAMVKLGRRAEAGATIDAALTRNPDSALTHANQGWTLLERGEPKKALEHFREALRLDPQNEWAQHGIVEALKARNFIYAIMLKYFLWMSRFSVRGQWGIVIGGYLGNRLLAAVAAANPPLAPWILPLQIFYVCFALMTWMAVPFFNLLLRLNRFGRLVLSREQTVASNWFGLCLLCALVALAVALLRDSTTWLTGAIIFGLLLIPVSAIYRCDVGWPRTAMAAFTIGLALVGMACIGASIMGLPSASSDAKGSSGVDSLFQIFLIGAFASSWAGNILRSQRVRR
jgi:tetratricopeptide (TPR) repeat protein